MNSSFERLILRRSVAPHHLDSLERRQVFAFLLAGASNTALSYLLYLFLLSFFAYEIAYSFSFVAGIFYSSIVNLKFTFKTTVNVRRIVLSLFVYLLVYLLGLNLLVFFVTFLGIPKAFGPLLVLIVTVPLTFFLLRPIARPSAFERQGG